MNYIAIINLEDNIPKILCFDYDSESGTIDSYSFISYNDFFNFKNTSICRQDIFELDFNASPLSIILPNIIESCVSLKQGLYWVWNTENPWMPEVNLDDWFASKEELDFFENNSVVAIFKNDANNKENNFFKKSNEATKCILDSLDRQLKYLPLLNYTFEEYGGKDENIKGKVEALIEVTTYFSRELYMWLFQYEFSPNFPSESFKDQVQRACLSISLNISEGLGRTISSAESPKRFLSIAYGSALETYTGLKQLELENIDGNSEFFIEGFPYVQSSMDLISKLLELTYYCEQR